MLYCYQRSGARLRKEKNEETTRKKMTSIRLHSQPTPGTNADSVRIAGSESIALVGPDRSAVNGNRKPEFRTYALSSVCDDALPTGPAIGFAGQEWSDKGVAT